MVIPMLGGHLQKLDEGRRASGEGAYARQLWRVARRRTARKSSELSPSPKSVGDSEPEPNQHVSPG